MDVTEQDYQLLSQYLDRELPAAAAEQLERRLAQEPQLKASFARLQTLQGQLRSAYEGVAAEAVPERFVALLQPARARILPLPHRQRAANWGFALAASLVVAVSATLVTRWDQHAADPGVDSELSLALESAPSRGTGWETLGDGRAVRPVLSFQNNVGQWCREYLLTGGDGSWHGVACRGDKGWTTTAVAATAIEDTLADYRPAGASDSTEIADFIDGNAAGIPLDAQQEMEAISRAWR